MRKIICFVYTANCPLKTTGYPFYEKSFEKNGMIYTRGKINDTQKCILCSRIFGAEKIYFRI